MATTAAVTTNTTPMEIDSRLAPDSSSGVVDDELDANVKDSPIDGDPALATTDTAMATTTTASSKNAVVFSPELLHQYYSRLFPFDFLHSWLSYGGINPVQFSRREFSMTIEPVPGEEIYIRYQSFSTKKELQDSILKRRPVKIDIGAVFSHPPKDHNSIAKSSAFQPVERELVFDIDLTDYDGIRQCGCSGAQICGTCWGFMKMAVKVMDEGLREDFGFEHVAWFYSGRRGVHAWVCDECARELTDAGRSAVASYFEVNLGTDKNKDVHLSSPLHPMLARAYQFLEPMFESQVLPGHKILSDASKWNAFLETIPEAAMEVRERLHKEWNSNKRSSSSSPQEKWSLLKKHLSAFVRSNKPSGNSKSAKTLSSKDIARLETWPVEVVFQYSYPRLDVNVSKMRNHLLKSPFCVHPKTGRVCVPFLASQVDDFDPFSVPTLPQLIQELDAWKGGDETVKHDWQKTSLKPCFESFQTQFLDPLLQQARKRGRDMAEKEAAWKGDF